MSDVLKKSLPVIVLLVLCSALVAGVSWWIAADDASTSLTDAEGNEVALEESLPAPLTPEQLAAYDVDMTNKNNPVAVLSTNKGTIEIELFEDTMPITAGNFAKLVEEGFYNGIKFHRVIEGFMIQSGDPITKTNEVLRYGTGGPGYAIPDEHIKGQHLTNVRGTIAMANSGPDSGGSQFFINLKDNNWLDFDVPDPNNSAHPVFGRVLTGIDVVDAIGMVETSNNDLPKEDIVIESATLRRN